MITCVPHPRSHSTFQRDQFTHNALGQKKIHRFYPAIVEEVGHFWILFSGTKKFSCLLSQSIPKYVMTCSGINLHFESPQKYPALNNTYVVTTIALKADWNRSSSFSHLNFCCVIPSMSSIQSSIGISRDLRSMAAASVTLWYTQGWFSTQMEE